MPAFCVLVKWPYEQLQKNSFETCCCMMTENRKVKNVSKRKYLCLKVSKESID